MQNSKEIRESFLSYFASHNHRRVPSSALVPFDDPTLMFTNAGMVQFKNIFTGKEKRNYSRATTSQKCMRVSGKHNDLENVGRTPRHHTFFEMLGNFSFGDYFKNDAIFFGWDFLTRVIGIPKERLYVAVYEKDDEAAEIWKKVAGLPDSKILRRDEKDNFWAMGPTGPCGPCSEIHYDLGPEFPEEDRELELWNLVFMQFERSEDGAMRPLPKPSIDTGMGFERLVSVVQKKTNNYDTDLFAPVIQLSSEIAKKPYTGTFGTGIKEDDVAIRVIADHSRSAAFLIADGVMPSNEGRGYVLRRIMRRAIRYAHKLGIGDLFYHKTTGCVVETMGTVYSELKEHEKLILQITKNEEERFRTTLETGMALIASNKKWLEKNGVRVMPGEVVFKLKDTFGFPEDLTELIGAEMGFVIDREGFESELEKARAKSEWKGSGEEAAGEVYLKLRGELGDTKFLGYEKNESDGKVLAIIAGGEVKKEASAPAEIEFACDQTPFYGEAGGQIGDTGNAKSRNGAELLITDAKKLAGGLIVHKAELKTGSLKIGDTVHLVIDSERRAQIRANHTATHILHWALQKRLGEHVRQAGSLVESERLRFDFTAVSPPSFEELEEIERLANSLVYGNYEVSTKIMNIDEAKQSGAKALFGEKYGDTVRVISIGGISNELCGGTHVTRSGDIGYIKIIQESSVAAGIRRITAITRNNAVEYTIEQMRILKELGARLKAAPAEIPDKIERMFNQEKELQKEIERLNRKLAMGSAGKNPLDDAIKINGINLLSIVTEIADPKTVGEMIDNFKEKLQSGVVVVGAKTEDKALIAVGVTDDLTNRLKAGEIVKELSKLVGGSGGGRPNFARAGGPNAEGLSQLVANSKELIKKMLS